MAKGLASAGLLAHVLVSKYCDHLPLYRQSQIFARQGVTLNRSTLANWVGGACWWLEPLRERLAAHVFAADALFADDTPIPVLDPGRGRTKTGRLWVYARDDRPWAGPDPPAAVYFYSPDRKAQQAIVEVEEVLFRNHPEVVDADLSDYFGSIPHADLLKSVARRIIDRRVLHLIKQWLECSVEETDKRGGKRRTTVAKDSRCGIPQGSPISPLLANLYMRRFVLAWEQSGLKQSLGSQIVNYADDFVILCKRGKAEEAELRMREIMAKLKLTVNEEKTQVCRIPEEEFDFLGYTFGRMYSARTGKAYMGYRPSKQSIKRMVRKIHGLTAEAMTWQEITALVDKLNRTLRGWANYYQVGTVNRAYRAIDSYTTMRLRRWLRNKHKVRCSGYRIYSDSYLYETLGLVRLSRLGCDVSWVKA